ncbi:SMP-30/gluconolactonase/LRE family protein [Sphingomonas sp. JC676]|uniref:SMP-30/gluconolactonase/LRE family protein n=1 Tax=Sphingomonas sp. JC676 TaxID=2768065 RepID=UPI001657D845|nr:SMP-30/gluconolactonase/LRE family protein [Sphingomonas sp. JC676]MBC9032963.1 SMP-30/gluconolactonase/LRE family protein [Sphingomonas sp. JC676]
MIETTRRTVLAGMAALPFVPVLARAETVGGITRLDPELDTILDVNTPIEVIADGVQWAEGPAWVKEGGYLLFSDPPANTAYRWKEGEGKSVFLKPSGLAGPIPAGVREAGSNGMVMDDKGRLVMADSGTRTIARVDLATKKKTVLAGRYRGKRFNSCNDLVIAKSGAIYFTDPPYGLSEGDTSPLKELKFNGVYRLGTDGKVTLVDPGQTRPNGIGLSPDQKTLYVSVSDDKAPFIHAYPLGEDGLPRGSRIFADFRDGVAKGLPGLPDGMKVGASGHLFASGPGGIHILAPDGRRLGLISTGKAAANSAFGEDGRTLFITSSDMVVRVRLKISGR